jgi:pyruvate dehydrogenase (quinone)
MPQTVSEFVWQRLHEWGVRRVFGYPGDGINGLVGALDKDKDRFDFVQARHEEMAAFMASAHAKFTGELGVCLATSGPGASHLLTGLYDARMDHMPVLAIVGQQARTAVGAHYQQELDLASMFKDVAGAFTGYAMVPAQVRHLIDRAVRARRSMPMASSETWAGGGTGGRTYLRARRSRRRPLSLASPLPASERYV